METYMQISGAAAIVPANDLCATLFDEFIEYIGRGERTAKTYITNLRQFAAWMRYTAITRPVRKDILSYRQYLSSEHDAIQLDSGSPEGWAYRTDRTGEPIRITCKPNTVAQYLRSVCQFFTWTAANGIYPNIAANIHAPKIRHDAHKKEAFSSADVINIERSIEAAARDKAAAAAGNLKDTAGRISRATEQGKRLYAMYLLTLNAGLRTIELERANIKDLEVINGKAYLYIWGKGHSEADQKKPIAAEVYQAITDYLECRTDHPTGSSPLFVSTGNRSGGKRIAARTISAMFKQAMKQAGYNSERLTAHSLRHTTGTAVMGLTKNLHDTQKYMRHCDPATTEIYIHVEQEAQEASIAQELFNVQHGKSNDQTDRSRLEMLVQGMGADQIRQLTAIAAAMAK